MNKAKDIESSVLSAAIKADIAASDGFKAASTPQDAPQKLGLSVVLRAIAFRPHIRRTEPVLHPETKKSRTKHEPHENPSAFLHKIKEALSMQDNRQKLTGRHRRLLESFASFVSDDGTYTLDPERIATELNIPRGEVTRFLGNGIQYLPATTRGRVILNHARPAAQNKDEDDGSGVLHGRIPSKSRRSWRLVK